MKAAAMRVTPELVAQFLHLPKGSTVIGACRIDALGQLAMIEFVISHPDLPEATEPLQVMYPEYKRRDPIVMTDWGLRTEETA